MLEYVAADPTLGVPMPRVHLRRGLTVSGQQLRRFLDAPGRPRDRIQAYLLVFTAARVGALRTLLWQQISWEEHSIALVSRARCVQTADRGSVFYSTYAKGWRCVPIYRLCWN